MCLPLWPECLNSFAGLPIRKSSLFGIVLLAPIDSILSDLVQLAFKKEFQPVGLSVVDYDGEMRRQYSHLSAKKRRDLAIVSSFAYEVFDAISRLACNQAIDIKIVSLVDFRVTWTETRSQNKDKIENPGLFQQQVVKNSKHAAFYAPTGFTFFALVASCIGTFFSC